MELQHKIIYNGEGIFFMKLAPTLTSSATKAEATWEMSVIFSNLRG